MSRFDAPGIRAWNLGSGGAREAAKARSGRWVLDYWQAPKSGEHKTGAVVFQIVGNAICKLNAIVKSTLDYLLNSANDYDPRFFGNWVEKWRGSEPLAGGGASRFGGCFSGRFGG